MNANEISTLAQLQVIADQALARHADVIASIKCYSGIPDLVICPMFHVTLREGYRNVYHDRYETMFHCAPDKLDSFLDCNVVGKFTPCSWSVMDNLKFSYVCAQYQEYSAGDVSMVGETIDGYQVIMLTVKTGDNYTLQLQTTKP